MSTRNPQARLAVLLQPTSSSRIVGRRGNVLEQAAGSKTIRPSARLRLSP